MGTQSSSHLTRSWLPALACDLLALAAAYQLTIFLRFHSSAAIRVFGWINRGLGIRESARLGWDLEAYYTGHALRIYLICAGLVCGLYALFNLYAGRRFLKPQPWSWQILLANLTALALFYVYFYLSRNTWHPRSFFVTWISLNIFGAIFLRSLLNRMLSGIRDRTGFDTYPTLLLGSGPEAAQIQRLLETFRPHGLIYKETITYEEELPFETVLRDLQQAIERQHAREIIAAERRFTIGQIMTLLEFAERHGVALHVLSEKFEVLISRAMLPADMFHGIPLIYFPAMSSHPWSQFLRRGASMVIAAGLLLVTLPVSLLAALLIKLTSPGPVFFMQERIGINRKPFRMFKFRTMRNHAEQEQAEMEELNESGGGLFKLRRDPRVTPAGRLLRRFSLDELPQLLNVLKGDMRLVGPRPLPQRDFANYYEDWHYTRHGGLPGLTCLWQVSGRSELDFHNMCILDIYYLRNVNWILDLKILLKTAWCVCFAKGAY